MRVAGQQRFAAGGAAAGHRPGVAALELRQAGLGQGVEAEAGDGVQVLPVTISQRLADHALGLPVQIKDLEVVGAQLVADMGQHRLGAKRGGEAVGHIAGHAQGVGAGEGPWLDAQQVELHRHGALGLELVDAVQVGQQRLGRGQRGVQFGGIAVGVFADAQGAEQAVGFQQRAAEDFRQLAAGQAAQDFHLEQAILGVDEAQGAVHIQFMLGLDMRHAPLIEIHQHLRLQGLQLQLTAALRLFAVDIPVGAGGSGGDDQGQGGQAAFHGLSLLWRWRRHCAGVGRDWH